MRRRTFLQGVLVGAAALLTDQLTIPAILAAAAPTPFTVYLTFDAGFSSKDDLTGPTVNVLDALAKLKVPATFFPNGKNLQSWEGALLARMLREGHAVGNRLWQETGNTAADQSAPTLLAAQYLKTEKKLRALIQQSGQDAADAYATQPKLYRRPGGDTALGAFLYPAGYEALAREPYLKPYTDVLDWLKTVYDYSGWHVSANATGKTKIKSVYGLTRRIVAGSKDEPGVTPFACAAAKQTVEAGQGLIVQLFDANKLTAQSLSQIILQLRAKGATFKPLPRPADQANTFTLGIVSTPTPNPNGAAC